MNEGQVERKDILPLMGVVKKQGDWVFAMCPSHPDGTKHGGTAGQSLGLSSAGVLRCFAGCSFADVMAALREAKRPASSPARQQGRGGWAQKAAYEYRDPLTSALIAVKGRFERPSLDGDKPEKAFKWRLPEGQYNEGIKAGGLTIAGMPLWGADSELGLPGRVWFAEGESATEAIRARNEIAVCGGWGASQRDFGEAFEVLRNREVILWPDNDVAGREYMAEVRRALRGIAKSVVTVTAPVPPKGDAVEYFQAGGTIDALLANVVTKPTVDVLGLDHFVVRVPTEGGPIAFDFAGISKSAGDMPAELTVTHLNPAYEGTPYSQRINILSQSARSQLETSLGKQFGKDGVNWTTVVSAAWALVRQTFIDQDRGAQIGTLGNVETLSFHVETLFPDLQPTIIFGDGSSAKTYLTYAIGVAIALGAADFHGMRIRRGGAVLIVDYETGGEQARYRIKRILLGMNMDPLIVDEVLAGLPFYYWPADGVPLPDQVEALGRFIEKHDVRFMVVDSGADACGGEPEKASIALAYFNALSRLPVTSVTICHITNTDADTSSQRPFGSRFWHNRARRTWYVKRDQEEESDDIDVAMLCRKINDGRKPRPLAFGVHFEGDSGAVTFKRQDFREVVAFENEAPIRDRVIDFLASQGGAPATIVEIAEGLVLANDSVKTALYRGDGKCFTKITAGTGRGNQTRWVARVQEA